MSLSDKPELTMRQRLARLVPSRWRWNIAHWIDKRRDVCWADLVTWILWDAEKRQDDPEGEPTLRPLLQERAAYCRSLDGCYCGKYVAGERQTR